MTTPEPSAPEPSELLPCPFCGSEASLFVNETFTGHNYVFCEGEDCHVSTPYSSDINVVIRGWNRRAALKPSPSPVVVEPTAIVWPKERNVKSRTDMHPTDALQVGLDIDNDVTVSLWTTDAGYSSVEFCNPGGNGGGRYPNTRRALIALMVAMESDAALNPKRPEEGRS